MKRRCILRRVRKAGRSGVEIGEELGFRCGAGWWKQDIQIVMTGRLKGCWHGRWKDVGDHRYMRATPPQ